MCSLQACISISISAIVGSQFMTYYYGGSYNRYNSYYSSSCYLGPEDSR